MQYINDIMEKIDDLSVRERAAIFIAVLAVIFFVWDTYLMASLDSRERILKSQLQQIQAEQTALNAELRVLIERSRGDPNAHNRERLASLRQEVESVKQEVFKSTRHLISPDRMASVLEDVLIRTEGLELIGVKGLGSTSLVPSEKDSKRPAGENDASTENAQNPTETDSLANAYLHGLQIVFNGNFMSTLEYIKKIELLENEFIWDTLQLTITDYPDGKVSITFFTLSLNRNWIDV